MCKERQGPTLGVCLIEVSIKRKMTVITTESHGFDSYWENLCYLLSALLVSLTEKSLIL